jgi:hypothetical protein
MGMSLTSMKAEDAEEEETDFEECEVKEEAEA